MKTTFLLMAVLAGATGCMDSMHDATVAVSVSAVSPAPSAGAVARGDTIRSWMDMPMDSASCAMRFTLHVDDSLGAPVAGRLLFADGYREMMFVPDSLLQPGTSYFAHMRDGMTMPGGMHSGASGGMMGGGTMMMSGHMPPGVVRMADGMGWTFSTGL